MALVAYDNSDSSDYEESDNDLVPTPINKKNECIVKDSVSKDPEPNRHDLQEDAYVSKEHEQSQHLFNHLPLPSTQKSAVIEEEDEFLFKKETAPEIKPKSKITVPSLSEFKDVKDTVPNAKPKITNGKKSGLLSILPQPKNSSMGTITSKTLIPHVLTQKPPGSTAKQKESIPSRGKVKVETKVTNSLMSQYSDDSDNDDIQNDFFSINKPVELPLEELPLEMEKPSSSEVRDIPVQKPRSIESYFKQDNSAHNVEEIGHVTDMSNEMHVAQRSMQVETSEGPSGSGEIALDEEAILKLCGSRGKRKREDIQIVDVNQQEVLADAREWLLKGLMDDTSKRVSASKRRGNEPTSQQKRKHQITYLAHQAKANEIELQNQWSNNRMTKRQTQSKYGF